MQPSTRTGNSTSNITTVLRKEIISGVLGPGTKLHQQALADRFRASRMPVRESLQALVAEGLVVWPNRHSAKVAPLLPDELREISEMRIIAESLAMRLAIPEITNRDLAQAESLQSTAETAGAEDFATLNTAFHQTLLSPCNRPRLLAHILELERLSQRYLMVTATELDYFRRSHSEHRALIGACRTRDADAACRLLERHITDASLALLARLGASSPLPELGQTFPQDHPDAL